MCYNDFTFHGVGQGLFYVGELHGGHFNFVYDCGTFDICRKAIKKEIIESEIIQKKYCDKIFDFVAISHLHVDHVNMLPEILKHLKDNGKIYLPYYPREYKYTFKAFLILNDINVDSSIYRLLNILYGFEINSSREVDEYQQYVDRVIFVYNNRSLDNTLNVADLELVIPNNLDLEQIESDNSSFKPRWYFKFYNQIINLSVLSKIEIEIENEIKDKSKENFEDYLNEYGINDIKTIYNKYFDHTLNVTSLVLLHYPENGPATLLTGDVEFDNSLELRLQEGFSEKNKCLGLKVFQIPHHGSYKNWELIKGDWKYNPEKLVCCFGWPNSYGHPSSQFYLDVKKCNTADNNRIDINKLELVYYDDALLQDNKEHSFKYEIEWKEFYDVKKRGEEIAKYLGCDNNTTIFSLYYTE